MRRIRSAGLPQNGIPTQQVQTAARFSTPGEQDWRVKLSMPQIQLTLAVLYYNLL